VFSTFQNCAAVKLTTLPLLPKSPIWFPPSNEALTEPDGLLAAGGALNPQWLIEAYCQGIFPWFEDDTGPIYWWCPSQRGVVEPGKMKISRSLRKTLKNHKFTVTADRAFAEVVNACAGTRIHSVGTWITPDMMLAYNELNKAGVAHSIEVWDADALIGGLYGLSLGRMFFGESMFATKSNASKIAFFKLNQLLEQWNFDLIDCQMMNPHLESIGAKPMSRENFLELLKNNDLRDTRLGAWQLTLAESNE
jgi:leucyl/phenylalanyl-tRNA--protein transferase